MIPVRTKEEKVKTFCNDCMENPNTCGKNPKNCIREEGSQIYFELYNDTVGCIT